MDDDAEKSMTQRNSDSKSSLVAVLDKGLLTSVRSPQQATIEDLTFLQSKKANPYTRNDGSRTRSPRVINGSADNSVLPLLGEKFNSDGAIQTLSPDHGGKYLPRSPSSVSVVSELEGKFDYMSFYNPHNTEPEDGEPLSDRAIISKLEKQLEKQAEMIEILIQQSKNQTHTPKSTQSSASKTNFTIPSSEPVKVSKIPDYDSMTPEETAKYETKFRNNFQQLANSYSTWNIEIPKIGELPLTVVHEMYEDVVKTIVTYQTAMKFKVGLVIIFAAIEFFGYKRNKIKAFKNFTKVQIKTIHKYDCYLLNFASSFYNGTNTGKNEEWPSWLKFLISIGTSITSFASIQGAANAMGWNAPEMILHEADKFVSPSDGPAKLKSDGISEVPVPPEGLQDPNEIIRQGQALYDTYEDVSSGRPVQPVETKPVEKDDYDDAYE
jgi:hypothetical protein